MLNAQQPLPRRQQAGFSLLEVLVAVLLVSIGLLGAAALFGKGIAYSRDTYEQQSAAMLANELLEIMRSDASSILDVSGTPKSGSGYFKAAGQDFPTLGSSGCAPLPDSAQERLACWARVRVAQTLPAATEDAVLKQYAITADANGIVTVRVAWPVKAGECLDGKKTEDSGSDVCTFELRSML
ncbi:type IV pilus modification protein PilV [Corticibacter populi]|uniref:Type IV pilus modification protein PilV n=1 Tax=Corticibacter populi TaxID=1550736 RepID=A0A3M6QYB7_9BURK|nr:type IV pilus modification protein PilV [Corticibacter populi]RMX07997.1 type IV pilus modification protein PilV [Corticibacter populi]RZS35239.1 type IV pilus assembly protein PilV [Corticibacter populi]